MTGNSWKDLNVQGRRLNRYVKLLDKLAKKETDPDRLLRLTHRMNVSILLIERLTNNAIPQRVLDLEKKAGLV